MTTAVGWFVGEGIRGGKALTISSGVVEPLDAHVRVVVDPPRRWGHANGRDPRGRGVRVRSHHDSVERDQHAFGSPPRTRSGDRESERHVRRMALRHRPRVAWQGTEWPSVGQPRRRRRLGRWTRRRDHLGNSAGMSPPASATFRRPRGSWSRRRSSRRARARRR